MSEFSTAAARSDAPQRLALQLGEVRFDYEDWNAEVSARAQLLPADGRPLALVAKPEVSHLAMLYACLRERYPVLLLHPRASRETQEALIIQAGASVVFDDDKATRRVSPNAPAPLAGDLVLIPTSGTTGAPRLTVFGHEELLAAARASQLNIALTEESRWALSLPFAHVGGLSVITRSLMARSAVLVAQADLGSAAGWKQMASQGVTHASLVPTQLRRLLARRVLPPASLKAVLVGGASAPPRLRSEARSAGWPALYTYGLTEACSQVATQSPNLSDPSGGQDTTCGPPLAGYEVRVGTDGTLQIRSPSLLRRYWGEPPRESGAWFATSDLGQVDEHGRVSVFGRKDNLIISGGENIAPEKVEAALLNHRGVASCCVVGVPDDEWGQRVVAVMAGQSHEEDSIRQALQAHLDRPAIPKEFIWVERIPTLPSGKCNRQESLALALRPQGTTRS